MSDGLLTTRCPVCDEAIDLASDGKPYHLTCSLDGDHDRCEPDDAHIPA